MNEQTGQGAGRQTKKRMNVDEEKDTSTDERTNEQRRRITDVALSGCINGPHKDLLA